MRDDNHGGGPINNRPESVPRERERYDRSADCWLQFPYQEGGGTPETLVRAFVGRGSALMTKGEIDSAILDFSQALSLNPNDFLALNNRGFAYAGKGDFERAMEDYDQAIQVNPNAALTFYNRALALTARGEFDHAI